MLELEIPWPPSVNHYKKIGRTILTKKGKYYQQRINTDQTKLFYYEVWLKIRELNTFKRIPMPLESTISLMVEIDLYPPDRKRRDIDNGIKLIFDSLQRGGLIKDDNQICRLIIQRCEIIPKGKVIVRISEL